MFVTPTLKELLERSRNSFRANLKGSDAWIWPNNVYASAKVLSGMVFEVFGFASYISRQIFAATADSDSLDRHGNEFGMARLPAQPARGTIELTTSGAVNVIESAIFARSDGVTYRALVSGSVGGPGTLEIDVVAVKDGKAGLAEAGTPLSIVSGVTGDTLVEVGDDGIVGGAEVEDDESFRERILFRKRNPPHGGAASDYVLWGRAVSGVSRIFVERLWNGPGTVRVFVLMDDLYANGIPPVGQVDRVADYIDVVRPSGAVVTVAAPIPVTVDITITDIEPDTGAVREAVVAELRDAFFRLGRPAGIDVNHGGMPYLAIPGSFSRSWIWQAVANATGEERHIITTPAADIALDPGEMAVLGTVNFV